MLLSVIKMLRITARQFPLCRMIGPDVMNAEPYRMRHSLNASTKIRLIPVVIETTVRVADERDGKFSRLVLRDVVGLALSLLGAIGLINVLDGEVLRIETGFQIRLDHDVEVMSHVFLSYSGI